MSITRFEDIEAWQLARVLCQRIFALTSEGGLSKDFSLKDQFHRSSGSIMDNIAEGFDAGGNNEFVRFLGYAKRSASEIQSQLYRIFDRCYRDKPQFDDLYERVRLIRSKIGAFISYVESSPRRSPASSKNPAIPHKRSSPENREPGTRNREFNRPTSER